MLNLGLNLFIPHSHQLLQGKVFAPNLGLAGPLTSQKRLEMDHSFLLDFYFAVQERLFAHLFSSSHGGKSVDQGVYLLQK